MIHLKQILNTCQFFYQLYKVFARTFMPFIEPRNKALKSIDSESMAKVLESLLNQPPEVNEFKIRTKDLMASVWYESEKPKIKENEVFSYHDEKEKKMLFGLSKNHSSVWILVSFEESNRLVVT